MADEDDAERADFERESLAEIYGPAFRQESEREWNITVTYVPHSSVTVLVPAGYPSRAAPTALIDAPFATDAEVATLSASVLDLHEELGGNEVVFEYVELLREQLGALAAAASADRAELEAAAAAPRHSAAAPPDSSRTVPADVVMQQELLEMAIGDAAAAASSDAWTFEPESTKFKQPTRRFRGTEEPHAEIEIKHGELIEDRKSRFEAHLAAVSCDNDVRWVHSQLLQDKRIARASHNVVCFRYFDSTKQVFVHDNDDDGETGAGNRLAEMMHLMQADNVFVMVSRWYGGVHLGPDRFRHFNNAAQLLLSANGFQRSKPSKGKRK